MSFEDLMIGLIGGLVATAVWTVIVYPAWLVCVRWRRYNGVEGDFHARLKGTERVDWQIRVNVDRNRLVLTGVDPSNERRTFDGEIVMSDEIARSGRGYYERSDEPDAFGFYEVEVINDDRILVIETWAKSDEERRAIVSGYVWERV